MIMTIPIAKRRYVITIVPQLADEHEFKLFAYNTPRTIDPSPPMKRTSPENRRYGSIPLWEARALIFQQVGVLTIRTDYLLSWDSFAFLSSSTFSISLSAYATPL